MAKYVLIPDSFKGTLSSEDICRIASEEILRLEPEAEICAIPVADGGEGTVDAFLAAVGGTRAEVPCTGPCGQEVMGFYGCRTVRRWWKWPQRRACRWRARAAIRKRPLPTAWAS